MLHGLDWIGLDWIGFGLDWIGLDWIGHSSCCSLILIRFCLPPLDWIVLGRVGLGWFGWVGLFDRLAWVGLGWIRKQPGNGCPFGVGLGY